MNRLASALRTAGMKKHERVAFVCPNIPAMLEAHYGVPLAGGILSGQSGAGNGNGISAGGILKWSSGGSAAFMGISGGTVNVSSGGIARSTSVSSGGVLNDQGTLTGNVTVSSGGSLNVLAGGIESATTVIANAKMRAVSYATLAA